MYEFFVAVTILVTLGFQEGSNVIPASQEPLKEQLARNREELDNQRQAEQRYLEWLTGNYIWLDGWMTGMGPFAISAEEYRANFTQVLLLAKKDEYPAIIRRVAELRRQSDSHRNDILNRYLPSVQEDIARLERQIQAATDQLPPDDVLPDESEDDLSALGGLIGGRDDSPGTDDRNEQDGIGVKLFATGTIRDDCKTRFTVLFREMQKFYGGIPRSTDVKADEMTLRISGERRATLSGGRISVTGLQADGQSIKMVVKFQFDPAVGAAIRIANTQASAVINVNDVTEIHGSGTGEAVLSYSGGGQPAASGGQGSRTIHWIAKRDHDDVWYVEVKFQSDNGRASLAERFRFDFRLDGKPVDPEPGADTTNSQLIRDGVYDLKLVTIGYGLRNEMQPISLGKATWKHMAADFANLRIEIDPALEREYQRRNIRLGFPIETVLMKKGNKYETAGPLLQPLGRWASRFEAPQPEEGRPLTDDDRNELARRMVEVSELFGHGKLRLSVSPSDNGTLLFEFTSAMDSYFFDGLPQSRN
ncbi:MAG: hypothetical protein RIK87_13105 [Fuerstiella sp.]